MPLWNLSVRAVEVNIFFRDHRGVYWCRGPRGALAEVPHLKDATDDYATMRLMAREIGEDEKSIDPEYKIKPVFPHALKAN